jgi:PAS domain-containing protein
MIEPSPRSQRKDAGRPGGLSYNAGQIAADAATDAQPCDLRPPFLAFAAMPIHTARETPTPEEAVRAANQRFYAAFESLNLAEMEAVWAHDEAVELVQPGWELLLGWDEVRERWARIFANLKRVRVAVSGIWVRVEGEVGWVACTARITTAFADGFDEATVQATNIFLRREGQWLLVAHHASPLPGQSPATVQ